MNLDNYRDLTKIVIVDDKYKEGAGIQRALGKKGISSLFLHITDSSDFDFLHEASLRNSRIIFLDLILESITGELQTTEQKGKHALQNLRRVIGDKDNAYILIVWTGRYQDGEEDGEEIVNFLQEKFDAEDANVRYGIKSPLKLISLRKDECEKDDGDYDLNIIQEKINTALEGIPAFTVFSEGERLAINGVGSAITQIVGDKENSRLQQVITSLSAAYGGHSVPDNERAKNALITLGGVFEDEIVKNIEKESFVKIPETAGLSDIEKCKINTSLIMTPEVSNGSGAVHFPNLNSSKRQSLIGQIIVNKKRDINSVDNSTYDKIIPIYIDVTPVCGSAQGNGLQYFVKGILFPENFLEKQNDNSESIKNLEIKSNYCYEFKYKITYEGETYKVAFNLKSYSTNSDLIEGLDPILKLRSNIVIDIQHKVASYISRPGHVLL